MLPVAVAELLAESEAEVVAVALPQVTLEGTV